MNLTLKSIAAFFALKGFETPEKREAMTAEEFATFAAEFKEEFGLELSAASMQTIEQQTADEQRRAQVIAAANSVLHVEQAAAEVAEGDEQPETATEPVETSAHADIISVAEQLISRVQEQAVVIENLSQDHIQSTPKKVKTQQLVNVRGGAHTATHLFGIEAPLFSMDKPWNKIAAKRLSLEQLSAAGAVASNNWAEFEQDFRTEFKSFAKGLAGRYAMHVANNSMQDLNDEFVRNLAAVDFSGFDNTGWGEQFIVRRQDALIAYIRMLPSITAVFPVRYGVQDKMVMTNAFFDSVSAAWQSGKYTKGGVKVEPILAEVFDAMIKHKFSDMKALEREYIGYLNREGSFPIKFSFVEWVMARMSEVALNEQNLRRINGFRVDPTAGTLGHYNNASDGLIRKITKYVRDGYMARETDLNTYTSSTIYDYVKSFAAKLNNYLPSLNGVVIYMNQKHVIWYLDAYSAANGTKLDYRGAVLEVPNLGISLRAVPGMGNSCFMMASLEGNVEFYEMNPGEMLSMYFQQDLDELWAMSVWKEGVGAYMIGKKNGTKEDQWIFVNDPFTQLAANATTADGSVNTYFKTGVNTGATSITDITSAKEGVLYTIVAGDVTETNLSKIAKSGKFSNLTAAWTPTAVGDYLEVYWDATASKFVEYGRKVTA